MASTFLVVSDDPALVRKVRRLGPEYDLRVLHATDGVGAMYVAEKERPQAVLVEDGLAGMDAYELLAKLRVAELGRSCVRILLTLPENGSGKVAPVPDADTVLYAPCDPRNLVAVVKDRVRHHEALDELETRLGVAEQEAQRLRAELERRRLDGEKTLSTHPLYDKVTLFPTLPLCIEPLTEHLTQGDRVDLLVIDVGRYYRMEEIHGWQFIDRVMNFLAVRMSDYCQTSIPEEVIPVVSTPGGGDFLLFICQSSDDQKAALIRHPGSRRERIDQIVSELGELLEQSLMSEFGDEFGRYITFHFGWTSIEHLPQVRLERTIYDAIARATQGALRHSERDVQAKITELEQIIREDRIRTVLHPIVNLDTFEIAAVEALSRGPKGSLFENPQVLFELAASANKVWTLDRICVRRSLLQFESQAFQGALFLNIDPDSLSDPEFRSLSFLGEHRHMASKLVIEITERAAINDLALLRELRVFLRELGIRIALDDVGAGYASFETIAELEPDFLKIDKSLIRGIGENTIKLNLVTSLVSFAKSVGIAIVAEGIETPEQLDIVQATGAHYGQGYLFAIPSEQIPLSIAKLRVDPAALTFRRV
ncbi:MAG: EAL domain-containing protein [Candidatus Schekmanbacteria bacterium]|nr:EAL domain-containing protein [Candidatus Schekmanbacteria bacterium]